MADKPSFPGRRFAYWCLLQLQELLAAISFLSIVPVPGKARLFQINQPQPRLFIGSAYFPVVGLLLGGILWLFVCGIGPFLPPLVRAAGLIIGLVCLTGGLHLDGLMDACDGLFSGRDRERKLDIMRDSRVGSFGVLGGGCLLLLKFSLFASLEPQLLALSFLFVLPVTRWAMVISMYCFPGARSSGLGLAVKQTLTLTHLLVAGLIALGLAVSIGHLVGLVVFLVVSLIAFVAGLWVTRVLGGLTGDIYGAIAELTEITAFMTITFFATNGLLSVY